MAELNTVFTDLRKAEEGIWVTYPGSDVECRIARLSNNPRFQQEAMKLRRDAKLRRILEGGFNTQDAKETIAPVVAEYVLLDWKNLTENGEAIPYTREKATELLCMPEMADFYDWVLIIANDVDLYRKDIQSADQGN